MKCQKPCPRFELGLPCPFPPITIITLRVPCVCVCVCVCMCLYFQVLEISDVIHKGGQCDPVCMFIFPTVSSVALIQILFIN